MTEALRSPDESSPIYLTKLGLKDLIPEAVRTSKEFLSLLAHPVFRGHGVPRGDGRPVMFLSGFMGSDIMLAPMAWWARKVGYASVLAGTKLHAGELDSHIGRAVKHLEQAVSKTGRKASIVGHSLGGDEAEYLASKRPDLVRQVITLGAPIVNGTDPRTRINSFVRGLSNHFIRRTKEFEWAEESFHKPLPKDIRVTNVYSRSDRIVQWESCIDLRSTDFPIEVDSSHIGMVLNPRVFLSVGQELAKIVA